MSVCFISLGSVFGQGSPFCDAGNNLPTYPISGANSVAPQFFAGGNLVGRLYKAANTVDQAPALRNPITFCQGGELALAVSSGSHSDPNLPVRGVFEITQPAFDQISQFQAPTVRVDGDVTLILTNVSQNVTLLGKQGITIYSYTFELFATQDENSSSCGAIYLSFLPNPQVNRPRQEVNSRLRSCNGPSCDPEDASARLEYDWYTESVSWPLVFGQLFGVTLFNNESITEAQLAAIDPLSPRCVILGNCTYVGDSWPSNFQFSSIFQMGPNARFTFGDDQQVRTLVVPTAELYPCSDHRFDGVYVGGRTNLSLTMNTASPSRAGYIYGAVNGLVVRDGGQANVIGTHIASCLTGVVLEDNTRFTMRSAAIDQVVEPEPFRGNNFFPPPGRGVAGITYTAGLVPDGFLIPNGPRIDLNTVDIQSFDRAITTYGRGEGALKGNILNSSIGDSRIGVDMLEHSYSTFSISNTFITTDQFGVLANVFDYSGITVNACNIMAGRGAVSVASERGTALRATHNIITNTPEFGILGIGAGISKAALNNDIDFAGTSFDGARGIGIFGSSQGMSTIAGNTIQLGGDRGIGILSSGSSNVTTANNAVQLLADGHVGIETSYGANISNACNQISSTATGSTRFGIGILSQAIALISDSCNFTLRTDHGLMMAGVSTNGRYVRNTFDRNNNGIAVGIPRLGSVLPVALIGNPPVMIPDDFYDNVWLVQRGAFHFPDQSLKSSNAFTVRNNDTQYFPIDGNLLGWFDDVSSETTPQGCPTACSILPPGWMINAPCLPEEFIDGEDEEPLIQIQQAIFDRVNLEKGDLENCGAVPECYEDLAEMQERFLKAYTATISTEMRYDVRKGLLSNWMNSEVDSTLSDTSFVSDFFAVELAGNVEDSVAQINLLDLRYQVENYIPCDGISGLWQESIKLSIKSHQPEAYDSTDEIRLIEIAEGCSEREGPGVALARRSLSTGLSDVLQCQIVEENLKIKASLSRLEVFPNPIAAGDFIKLSQPLTGKVRLVNATGKIVLSADLIDAQQIQLPANLPAGFYILHFPNIMGLSSIKMIVSDAK